MFHHPAWAVGSYSSGPPSWGAGGKLSILSLFHIFWSPQPLNIQYPYLVVNTDKYSSPLLVLWRQKTWNNGQPCNTGPLSYLSALPPNSSSQPGPANLPIRPVKFTLQKTLYTNTLLEIQGQFWWQSRQLVPVRVGGTGCQLQGGTHREHLPEERHPRRAPPQEVQHERLHQHVRQVRRDGHAHRQQGDAVRDVPGPTL